MATPDPSVLQRNRLGEEPSLYLRQHARQQVCWQPWDQASLSAARELQRPLLLSIGYSSCHWCHVMSREAFSDPEIVGLMNAHFVNVKVDREERPDLDSIYQGAHQVMRGRGGGWPLTVFADPHDLQPFFIGTYFPVQPHPHLPGFRQVLLSLLEFMQQPQLMRQEKQEISRRLGALMRLQPDAEGSDVAACREAARDALGQIKDSTHGGFGGAPKFPMTPQLEHCLFSAGDLRQHALDSLGQYARSGLYDHVRGGFFRYCVDAEWRLPHFEKMLHDNALLLRQYALAQRLRPGQPLWQRAASGIVDWLLREMMMDGGGFASALDADDGQGEEGGDYLWDKERLKGVLGPGCEEFAAAFGMERPPQLGGKWHLCMADGRAAEGVHDASLEKLRLARGDAISHAVDDKLLTQLNGLAIAALALAGRTFARPDWVEHAQRVFDHINDAHTIKDGCLLRMSVAGKASGKAFAGDYAAMIMACLELMQCEWQPRLASLARAFADRLLLDFANHEGGGFYMDDGSEELLARPMQFDDDAGYSANAIAAMALHRLGALLSEPRYCTAAAAAVNAALPWMQRVPVACCGMLQAAEVMLRPCVLLLDAGDNDLEAWRQAVPVGSDLYVIPAAAAELPPSLAAAAKKHGQRTVALACTGTACLPPAATWRELQELLGET